ncbi:MAG: hypothetical protein AAF434_06275 [Pseudomonadota bacterium]
MSVERQSFIHLPARTLNTPGVVILSSLDLECTVGLSLGDHLQ